MKNTNNHYATYIGNKVIYFTFLGLLLSMTVLAEKTYAVCYANISATTPKIEFSDNGDGTVTHLKTGLMWNRCSEGQLWNGSTCTGSATPYKTWQRGLKQAESLNNGGGFAGFTDWRVPNVNELSSIIESHCINPAVNSLIFPVTQWDNYLTSSLISGSNGIWRVEFSGGIASSIIKDLNGYGASAVYYVRLVRGGQ